MKRILLPPIKNPKKVYEKKFTADFDATLIGNGRADGSGYYIRQY
jgi:hypothetical protein